jgi:hypothetical protein
MLRVLDRDSRVLRKIVGPKREEEMRDWIKLHNEKLLDLYCSQIWFGL